MNWLRVFRAGPLAAALVSAGCAGEETQPVPEAEGSLALAVDEGCAVLQCPNAESDCCTEILSSVSGGQAANYARRDELIRVFDQSAQTVHAEFAFDAPEQSGRILFNLGRNVSIYQVRMTATITGSVDSYVGLTLFDAANRGCAHSFSTQGAVGGTTMLLSADLTGEDSCFNGTPGVGSVLEISIFSTGAGTGVFEIANLELIELDTPD